ncbi:MAG: hypothetical protein L0Z48_13070 [candidate division Zixibacteria bacterium]|nr:hypothetical protein [candidate division Zixibacteria bacterium]
MTQKKSLRYRLVFAPLAYTPLPVTLFSLSLRLSSLAAALCGLTLTAQAANFNYDVIAYSGQSAVGTPGSVYSTFFNPRPALGDDGKVCYAASLVGGAPPFPSGGFWQGDGSVTSKFFIEGDAAPDTVAGTTFVFTNGVVANGLGQAAFLAAVSSGLSGIWAGSPSSLSDLGFQLKW